MRGPLDSPKADSVGSHDVSNGGDGEYGRRTLGPSLYF